MNNRILIIDKLYHNYNILIKKIGYQAHYYPDITRQQIIEQEEQYIGMIVRSKTTIDEELLDKQKQIKFVARAGAGIDQLDIDYLEKRQITVLNVPEANRNALGEHVLGMLLSLANNLRKGDGEVRKGIWEREDNRGFELSGKTIALLGYGHMGSAVAQKLTGFGCRVIAFDKYKTKYGDLYAEEATMEEVFAQADIFSLHVPLTTETDGLVDLAYFKQFKKQIVFVNAARGSITKLSDLNTAMTEGLVKYAALDVLENEKLATLNTNQQKTFDQLKQNDNVLFSPHVGGWSAESYQKINEILAKKIDELGLDK